MSGTGGSDGHGTPDQRGWRQRWRPLRDDMRWPRHTPPTVAPHEPPPPDDADQGVRHEVAETPAQVEAYWREAPPRAEAAMVRAEALAPTLVGMTVQEAEQEVARDPDLLLRVLVKGELTTLEAVFGRINVLVADGHVTDAWTG